MSSPSSNASDDLRRRLLNAAVELLREPDTPLDLRKVAERAGKSRSAPYLVFGKGDTGGVVALRIAVAAEGARIMYRVMAEAAEKGGDTFERLRRVASAFLSFVDENPRLFRLMYGSGLQAVAGLGEGGFRDHPEFASLLAYRDRAGAIVASLIEKAQDAGVLPTDPPRMSGGGQGSNPHETLPSLRYLQIAWATMIGVSVLREDDLLRAVGWNISVDDGARLVAESVLGVDPERAGDAMQSFLQAQARMGTGDATSNLAEGSALELALSELFERNTGLRRAANSRSALKGARILWIDDNPGWVEETSETLLHLGATVEMHESTASALRALHDANETEPIDIIVSDIARRDSPTEGLRAIPELRDLAPDTPILFFIADYDPQLGVPEGAFGITNELDELFHLIMDALEGR